MIGRSAALDRPAPAAVALLRRGRVASSAPVAPVLLATVLLSAAALSGRADVWLVLATGTVAHRLSDRRHTVVSCLPAAAVLLSVAVVGLLTVLGPVGLRVLASPSASRGLLVTMTAVALPWLLRRRGGSPGRLADRAELVACLPALLLLLTGAWLSRQALAHAAGGMLAGWDSGAHLLASAALSRTGELSYDSNAYPRGLHALVTLVAGTRGPLGSAPEDLELLLRTQVVVVWVLHALLTATVALVTLRMGDRRGLADGPTVAAAAAAGLLTLSPFVFGFTMPYGFNTSIALAFLLAMVSLELVSDRDPRPSTLLLACAVTAVAHSYQLALPVVAVPLLVRGAALLRDRGANRRWWAATVLLAVVAWPPVWSVAVNTGVGTVNDEGFAGPLPAALLYAGLASTSWLAWRARGPQVAPVLCMVLTMLGVAVLSAWLAGASLGDYYPRKLLWHVGVLTLPMTATSIAEVLGTLARRTQHVPFLRLSSTGATAVIALAVTTLAVPGPYMAASGGWSLADGVVAAVVDPQEERAACTLDSTFARQVVFRLLHFYNADPTPPPPAQGSLPDCPEPPREE